MKKSMNKKLLGVAGIGLGAVLLSSCTANFCSDVDRAQMAYPYEQGVTVYCNEDEYNSYKAENSAVIAYEESINVAGKAIDGNDKVFKYVPYTINDTGKYVVFGAAKASYLSGTIISGAYSSGYSLPSLKYWAEIDSRVLEASLFLAEKNGEVAYLNSKTSVASDTFKASVTVYGKDKDGKDGYWAVNPFTVADSDGKGEGVEIIDKSVLRRYGHVKFSGVDGALWGNFDSWTADLYKNEGNDADLGMDHVPTAEFASYYKNTVIRTVNNNRSCIATRTAYYGHYGTNANWEVKLQQKDWGYAWKMGFLEGLLVYPVSWLVDTFAFGMDPSLSGVGQIWALIFVTLIVRGLLLLITFKSTMDTQKMTALQPEMAKLQTKYPNSNTNQAEKQRLAQEQMALYRRHKIHPFGQILMMIVQFPVFICVWSGLQGSAALSTGEFLGMRLSDNINTILMNFNVRWYANENGWWTALVLFILMAGVQVMAMMLPKIFQKVQEKKLTKLGKNPAATDQQKQMKWMSIGMMVFTIVMGFMLPSAMGIYWLIGGLISMIQTLITQLIMAKAKKRG